MVVAGVDNGEGVATVRFLLPLSRNAVREPKAAAAAGEINDL